MTLESYSPSYLAYLPLAAPIISEGSHKRRLRLLEDDGSSTYIEEIWLVKLVEQLSRDLAHIDAAQLVANTIRGIHDGASIAELDQWLIQTAAMSIAQEPEYGRLAARLLSLSIDKELRKQGINSFSQSVEKGYACGLLGEELYALVNTDRESFAGIIKPERTYLFDYFGLRTVYDRYLLKAPESRKVIESPQYFFLRVACGLSTTEAEAREFYNLISTFHYMPATPTLFNSGTRHPQMSSCYLLDSPEDSLESIYDKYKDIALLSKFSGGIGVSYSRVRSRGSLIAGTNGKSNGIIPFLKTLDSSVAAVNQGGKRKGAACIYLESWHADIFDFLSLRDNTGDEAARTHNLNLANWIPDLFMKRVENDEHWSLFDPKDVPQLTEVYGEAFEAAYEAAEAAGKFRRQIKARELYGAMMKTLAQTGNGWMTFKDSANRKGNQTLLPGNVIHLSNLCTEILEVTSAQETAVCNLGSINLTRYVVDGQFDFALLAENVELAVKYLDRVIDINFYPIATAEAANSRWRPVGLGIMGLQNVFFQLKLPFGSEAARALSTKIQEEIYYHALVASNRLAKELGPHRSFAETRASRGDLQFDLWGVVPAKLERWHKLKAEIKEFGLRNSLLLAIAPTATIASITGAYECIEPQLSNLFKRETLSGEFLQINPYLVGDLRRLGLWDEGMRQKITLGDGSIQHIEEIPAELRELYRTVWEISQRVLIDMAAERGAFLDQGQSLNLFVEQPTIGKLSSMYAYLWKRGVKTAYYVRSRGATKINKATVSAQQAVACSLENPESCESCS